MTTWLLVFIVRVNQLWTDVFEEPCCNMIIDICPVGFQCSWQPTITNMNNWSHSWNGKFLGQQQWPHNDTNSAVLTSFTCIHIRTQITFFKIKTGWSHNTAWWCWHPGTTNQPLCCKLHSRQLCLLVNHESWSPNLLPVCTEPFSGLQAIQVSRHVIPILYLLVASPHSQIFV
jgi:hypothetical protein